MSSVCTPATTRRSSCNPLRAGAGEFLHAPFDLSQPARSDRAPASVVFARGSSRIGDRPRGCFLGSTKPGSGASTIATQTAFFLQRLTSKRWILLADFDLTGGTIGFYLQELSHNYSRSLVDALQHAEHLDLALWNSLTVNYGGVDILPAPATRPMQRPSIPRDCAY